MAEPFIPAPISQAFPQFNPGLHLVENWHRGFGSCWHSHHAGFHSLILSTPMLHSFHLDVGQAQPPYLGCRHHARAKIKEWRMDCQSLKKKKSSLIQMQPAKSLRDYTSPRGAPHHAQRSGSVGLMAALSAPLKAMHVPGPALLRNALTVSFPLKASPLRPQKQLP